MMLCSSHMQTTFVQESTANQVKTVILQQHWHVHFHKQADKMNHGARVGHHSHNKSIIINQIIKNHGKILKLLQLKKFSS